MGCEHAQAAGGQTAPQEFEENTLSEVKRVIASMPILPAPLSLRCSA